MKISPYFGLLLLGLLFVLSCDEENPLIPVDECGVSNGDNYVDEICGSCSVRLWNECYDIEETTELDLSELTGEIPPEIENLTNLTELILSYNQLTGEIPSEIGKLTNLTELSFNWNQLTGEIPSELGDLTNLILLKSFTMSA